MTPKRGGNRNRRARPRPVHDPDEFVSTVPRWARVAALVVLIAMVLGVLATVFAGRGGTLPVPPSQPLRPDGAGELVLEVQSPWVGPGDVFEAEVALPDEHGPGELWATVREPITSADELSPDPDDNLGSILADAPAVTVSTSRDAVALRLPIAGRDPRPDAIDLDGGVYPLVIDFVPDDGETLRLITFMIVLPNAGVQPRSLALTLDLSTSVSWSGGGVRTGDTTDLVGALVLLNAYSEVPTTLRLTPALADAIAQPGADQDLALELRSAAANPRSQVLHGPYVDVPLGGWAAAGLDLAIIEQFDAGLAALDNLRDPPIDATTWLLGPTDSELTTNWLAARGVRYLVVGPERLEAATRPNVVEGRSDRSSEEQAADAPSFDPFLSADSDLIVLPARRLDPQGGALAVHRLLAESALGVVDQDSDDDRSSTVGEHPMVVLVDTSGGAGRSQLRALLEALVRPGGPVQARTVAEASSALKPSALRDGRVAPPDVVDLRATQADLSGIAADIDAYVATAGSDDPRSAEWRRMLLVAGAGTATDRAGLASDVRVQIQAALAGVELPATDLITVTSHRADLPIAVRNTTARRLRLAVQLDSSDLLVDVPNQLIELEPGETVDLSVPVRLNRAGEFSLQVTLTTPDGRFALAEQELRVRSTSIPGAGIAVSVGALAFLAVWWLRHLRRDRRRSASDVVSNQEAVATDASVEEPVP